jgi:hypothetical protein
MRLLLAFLLLSTPAAARTWQVGPDAELKQPSDAARVVGDGDVVQIAPGEYFDCASWNANGITIAGGPGVVLTDRTCDGKAILVANGTDIRLRGLTFTRARVPDGNGAGIRAQGGNLAVQDCIFTNNEVAILAASNEAATITISGTSFERNGACNAGRCGATLAIGRIGALLITDSIFTAARAGTLVQSAAIHTEIRTSRLEDGPEGRSTLLIDLAGPGRVLIEGNTLEKGPNSAEPGTAIAFRRGDDGTGPVRIAGNTLRNDTGQNTALVRDWSAATPVMENNTLPKSDTEITSSGVLRFRASLAAHEMVDTARSTAGWAKRGVRRLLPF